MMAKFEKRTPERQPTISLYAHKWQELQQSVHRHTQHLRVCSN